METIDVDNTWSLYKKLYLTLDSTQLLRPLDLPIDTTKDNANLFTINNGKRPSSSSIACLEELQTRSKRIKRFEESASEEKKARLLTRLDIPLNDYFKSRLKYHQLEGVEFMWKRIYKKKAGCLLSHAMGLGKTIQTIALLTTLYEHLHRHPEVDYPTGKRVLILAPLITLSNWVNEFRKWHVDGFSANLGQIFNFGEMTPESRNKRIIYLKYWYTNGGVMLMNYDQLRYLLMHSSRADDEYYRYLINPGPDVVVLDEGHRIRNAGSQLYKIVSEFRTLARICLTGYPLQNHLLEYYHMLEFVAPGILGPQETFKAYFTFYIERSYANSLPSIKQKAAIRLYTLQLLTEEVTHRRDALTLQEALPFKTEFAITFKMTDIQYEGYVNALKSIERESSVISNLLLLRTICNHPKILQKLLSNRESKRREQFYINNNDNSDTTYMDEQSVEETVDEVVTPAVPGEAEEEELVSLDINMFDWATDYFKNDGIENWNCSNKMSFIVDLATECSVIKEKIIIVSHSLACHDYLQHLFSVLGIGTLRIDGNTPLKLRQAILDDFESDESKLIMLLSAKAAAIGINVTSANRIVLIDQDWNPLYDEQSIGRIYRYGQLKPVTVYRLVTASTIEERIFAQSVHKKSISRRLIDNKASMTISKEELKEYYIQPSLDLPAIDINKIRKELNPDFITYSALLKIKDHVTDFKLHDMDNAEEYDPYAKLSAPQRREAVSEASRLLKEWKRQRRK